MINFQTMYNKRIYKVASYLFVMFLWFHGFMLSALALQPTDEFFDEQSYITHINADTAWNTVREAPDIVVAIIDTGVDIDHPDLRNNIWRNEDEFPGNGLDDDGNGYVDDVNGWDFITNSPDPNPKFSSNSSRLAMNHGTLVAGIVGAQGGNGKGIAGIAWRIKIMPLRVLDGAGNGDTISVTKAIKYARENGADIINLSFIGEDRSQSLELALEQAYRAGILIVAAAGNEVTNGVDMDITPRYPVCEDGPINENWVIGVTSVDQYDRKASFSNYGLQCIDISAPGVRAFTTQLILDQSGYKQAYGGGWTGTSVSTPQVSGVAALVKAIDPDISLLELQRLILERSDNINDLNPEWQGKMGQGRLNAASVVVAAKQRVNSTNDLNARLITGAGPGGGPHVRHFNLRGETKLQWFAYEDDYTGGVNVATGDVTNNGFAETITAPQSNHSPEIKVFNRFGTLQTSFFAYDQSFTYGVQVATGDVDGDGVEEIITVPNKGGGPHVRIFNRKGYIKSEFFAFNEQSRVGVTVAVADVDKDGEEEIVVASGEGSMPIVRIFDWRGQQEGQFFAFDPSYTRGMSVAAYDGLIVVGGGRGDKPYVRAFDYLGNQRAEFLAYDQNFRGGVKVSIADVNSDTFADIITGPQKGGGPHLRVFDKFGTLITQWMAYNPGFRGGISVTSAE